MEQKRVSFVPASGEDPTDCGFGHACSFCRREAECTLDKPAHNRRLNERRLTAIDQVVMVLANKGGVGKSTVAANLAAALARRGFRVGLGDADVHGPNAAQFFGQQGKRVRVTDDGIAPRCYTSADGRTRLAVGSLGFFLPDTDTPVVWRDAYKFDYVHHLLGSYDWGDLDFWVLDMPPGTGNELITLCDLLEGANLSALLVTTPQAVALLDTLKAARFCRERNIPMLGVVENMAGIVCPHCNGEIEIFPRDPAADDLARAGVETLARLPLSRELAFGSDSGEPIVDGAPESIEAAGFDRIAQRVIEKAKREQGEFLDHQLAELLGAPEQLEALRENEPDSAELREQLQALLDQEQRRLRNNRT